MESGDETACATITQLTYTDVTTSEAVENASFASPTGAKEKGSVLIDEMPTVNCYQNDYTAKHHYQRICASPLADFTRGGEDYRKED